MCSNLLLLPDSTSCSHNHKGGADEHGNACRMITIMYTNSYPSHRRSCRDRC
jgi:hypothetical protein